MDWQSLIQGVGFPIAATCALAFVVYKIGTYFVEKVYEPTQARHDKLVTKLESTLDSMQNAQFDLVQQLTRLVTSVASIEARQTKTVEVLDKLCQNVDELEQRIKQVEVR